MAEGLVCLPVVSTEKRDCLGASWPYRWAVAEILFQLRDSACKNKMENSQESVPKLTLGLHMHKHSWAHAHTNVATFMPTCIPPCIPYTYTCECLQALYNKILFPKSFQQVGHFWLNNWCYNQGRWPQSLNFCLSFVCVKTLSAFRCTISVISWIGYITIAHLQVIIHFIFKRHFLKIFSLFKILNVRFLAAGIASSDLFLFYLLLFLD